MKNSPSRLPTNPTLNPEAPKSSKFRLAIAFILTICTGVGIGKCVYDRKDAQLSGKTDTKDAVRRPDAGRTIHAMMLRRCRANLFRIANHQCGDLSEEEINRRYLEREKANLEKRAFDIIAKLKITDGDDQAKLLEAVLNGCSEIKSASGKTVELTTAPSAKQCGPLKLAESPRKNWLPINEEQLKDAPQEIKDLVRLYLDKNEEEVVRRMSFDKEMDQIRKIAETDEEFRKLGLTDYYKKMLDLVKEVQKEILAARSEEERMKVFCSFQEKVGKHTMTDAQRNRVNKMRENGIDLDGIDDSELFELFALSMSSMTGLTMKELDESCGKDNQGQENE